MAYVGKVRILIPEQIIVNRWLRKLFGNRLIGLKIITEIFGTARRLTISWSFNKIERNTAKWCQHLVTTTDRGFIV